MEPRAALRAGAKAVQAVAAARLFSAAEATQERADLAQVPALRAKNERALAAARGALGEEEFAAWAAGGDLPLDRAVAEAQSVADDAARAAHTARTLAPRPRRRPDPARAEALKLVAQGMTNARVVERLCLSPPPSTPT